jgi:hypothetical protein
MRMLSKSLLVAVAAGAVGAGSAHADTFCVTPATGCDGAHTVPTITAGLTAATDAPGADTLQLGAATYSENGLDYEGDDPVTLVGAGRDQTTVQRLTAQNGSVTIEGKGPVNLRSLRVHLLASANPQGTSSEGTLYEDLRFDAAPGATSPSAIELDADGAVLRSSAIDLPSGGQCVYATAGDAPGSTIEDTQITGCSTGVFVSGGTMRLNRVRLDSTIALNVAGGTTTVDDSLLLARAGGTGVLLALSDNGGATVRVRHSDVIGTGTGTGVESFNHVKTAQASLFVSDSIIRGFTSSSVRDGNAMHPANVTLDHVSYDLDTATVAGPGNYNHTNTLDDPDPKFVNAAAGDYRLQAGSPLLDQNAAAPAADEPATDLDGSARIINGAADLGAYERALAPAATTGDASAITSTSATVAAGLNGGGAIGSWQVLYGPTAAYGAQTTPQALAPAVADQALAAALGGLTPVTTYHYAVRLTTASGTVTGADRTFTTAAVPPQQDGPVVKPAAPVLGALRLAPSAFKAGRTGGTLPAKATRGVGARLRFTLTKAATVTLTVRRVTVGVRSGKRCLARRAGRRGKACSIETKVGRAVTVKAKQGTTTLRFSGRVGGRRLAAGRYVLLAQPTGGAARRAGFRIVR